MRRSLTQSVLFGVVFIFVIACGVLISTVRVPAQSTVTIRPTAPNFSSGGFQNAQMAFDANDSTAAGTSLTVACNSDCTAPKTVTTTWHSFEGGYIPSQLLVRWSATSAFFVGAGRQGKFEGKVEYSLDDGGSWQLLEAFVQQHPPDPSTGSLPVHNQGVSISSTQETLRLIRFRGHLPKGGYDVPDGRHTQGPAPSPALHG